ncbi:MAG: regulatory protein RecX [Sciscionella sp.]
MADRSAEQRRKLAVARGIIASTGPSAPESRVNEEQVDKAQAVGSVDAGVRAHATGSRHSSAAVDRRTNSTGSGPEDPVAVARSLALRLLATRPRSRAELATALHRKAIEPPTAETVLDRLAAVGLVDDVAFAEMWVRSRHRHSGQARSALVAELRRKGVEEAAVRSAVAEIDAADEEDRARQLVRKRVRTMPGALDATTATRRLVATLARKGYPQALSLRVVRDELTHHGLDGVGVDETAPDS